MTRQELVEWIEYLTQPHKPGMVLQSATGGTVAVATAHASDAYLKAAAKDATPGTAPGSIFEGIATIADMSRVRAGYSPLDPTGAGDKAHLLQFMQNIADVPMLSLVKADATEDEAKSDDPGQIIESLVEAISVDTDDPGVAKSVQNLVEVANSYVDIFSGESCHFCLNLLQTNSSGDVKFGVYSWAWRFRKPDGVIESENSFSLTRMVYQLSPAAWHQVKDLFENQKKTTTQGWIKQFTTPKKGGG